MKELLAIEDLFGNVQTEDGCMLGEDKGLCSGHFLGWFNYPTCQIFFRLREAVRECHVENWRKLGNVSHVTSNPKLNTDFEKILSVIYGYFCWKSWDLSVHASVHHLFPMFFFLFSNSYWDLAKDLLEVVESSNSEKQRCLRHLSFTYLLEMA